MRTYCDKFYPERYLDTLSGLSQSLGYAIRNISGVARVGYPKSLFSVIEGALKHHLSLVRNTPIGDDVSAK